MTALTVQPLDVAAFARYGWMLGTPFPGGDPAASFHSEASDFWHAHGFDAGAGGQPQVLWVAYRDTARSVAALEQHRLTEQALIPLTGSVIQFVAISAADGNPDLDTLAAFRVPPGQGLCMRQGCWHATRVVGGQVLCAMLTRRSTTRDLVRHLAQGAPAVESAIVSIPIHTWSD